MLIKLRHFKPFQQCGFASHLKTHCFQYSSTPKPPNYFTPNQGCQDSKLNPGIYKYLGLISLFAGGGIYYLLSEERYNDTTLFSGLPAKIRTIPSMAVEFTYTLDSADGPIKKNFSHVLLSEEEVQNKLKNGENKVYVNREGNNVKSWDINSLPSSDTGEDRYSTDIISKSDLEKLLTSDGYFWKNWWNTRTKFYLNKQGEEIVEGDGKRDVMMFSVFDGHGGPYISDLLSRTLHGCLAWNIAKLLNRGHNDGRAWENEAIGGRYESGLKLSDEWTPASSSEDGPQSFAQMMAASFLTVDANLIQSTWSTLFSPVADNLPGLPPHSPTQLGLANLFDNGSCAITAIVDIESDKLYVANVGDTRAIAGWWNSEKGEWRCDILTEDATCENEQEAERIRNEHPEDERHTAIHNQGYGDTNRVLGGLQPSRAFGDDAYKIGYDDFQDIQRALFQREPHRRWRWFEECPSKTPPYVTAKPEIAIRDIHPRSREELKFVVLATDGLWDRITSEEASYLVTSHLMHETHPDQSKVQVRAVNMSQPTLWRWTLYSTWFNISF
ncbi:uncharacterized protein L199_002662 [Kwoniella botswanensis]|uniref:uncharacterized protein n=1 Tax=Kwoniella botswanensis TaxID=1268659 RepID=UPI00315CBAA0